MFFNNIIMSIEGTWKPEEKSKPTRSCSRQTFWFSIYLLPTNLERIQVFPLFPLPPPPPAVGKESPALCSYTRPRYGHSFIKPLLDTCAVSHVFKVFWVPACLGVARWSAPTPWPDPAHHVMCDEGQANQGQRVIGSISTRAVLCFRKMPPGHVWRNISRRHVSI